MLASIQNHGKKIELPFAAMQLLFVAARAKLSGNFLYGPDADFGGLMLVRPMITNEKLSLVASEEYSTNDDAFASQISHIVDKYKLHSLFFHSFENGIAHRAWRPTGYDSTSKSYIFSACQLWRESYRSLKTHQQIFAVSLIYLYAMRLDKTYLINIPRDWSVLEAIAELHHADAFHDWMKLYLLARPWNPIIIGQPSFWRFAKDFDAQENKDQSRRYS